MNHLKIFLTIIIIFGIVILSPNFYFLVTDKNYYGFPAVTQCRICNKTVWEWQSYERRTWNITNGKYYLSDTLSVDCCQITGSGLVHKSCEGNPKVNLKVCVK